MNKDNTFITTKCSYFVMKKLSKVIIWMHGVIKYSVRKKCPIIARFVIFTDVFVLIHINNNISVKEQKKEF